LGKDTIYPGVEVAQKIPKKFLTKAPHFYIFDLSLKPSDAAASVFSPFHLIPPGIRQQVFFFYGRIGLSQSEYLFARFTPPLFTSLLIPLAVINLLRVFHGHDTFRIVFP
jgi:hypothetical protein